MISSFRSLAVIALLLIAGSACTKRIEGSGNIIQESRALTPFIGIENSTGNFQIVLQQSDRYSIHLEGQDNIVPLIETVVHNGFLKIRFREGNAPVPTRPLVLRIQTPAVMQIVSRGMGSIESSDVWKAETMLLNLTGDSKMKLAAETKRLKLFISGNGDIRLSGKSDRTEISLHGSGNVSAFELHTRQATASISGSGQAELSIADHLEAEIAGHGTLYYRGNPPSVKSEVAGNGKLIQVKL